MSFPSALERKFASRLWISVSGPARGQSGHWGQVIEGEPIHLTARSGDCIMALSRGHRAPGDLHGALAFLKRNAGTGGYFLLLA